MVKIALAPDISRCIETTAKKELDSVTSELLISKKTSKTLQEKAEMLRQFLLTADFKKLRAESEPHLIAGKKVLFSLSMENGILRHSMTFRNVR